MKLIASWMPVTKVRHSNRDTMKLVGRSSARQYWSEEFRSDRDEMLKDRGLPMLCDSGMRIFRVVVCKDRRPGKNIAGYVVQVQYAFDKEGGVRNCGST
jgi:hypothetical protein